MVLESDGLFTANRAEMLVLRYYASFIAHLLPQREPFRPSAADHFVREAITMTTVAEILGVSRLEQRVKDLERLLRETPHMVVPWVGAGMSIGYGFPAGRRSSSAGWGCCRSRRTMRSHGAGLHNGPPHGAGRAVSIL